MRVGPHNHPCGTCGTKTECCGELADNYDGEPWVICMEYHQTDGTIAEFICEGCELKQQDAEDTQ